MPRSASQSKEKSAMRVSVSKIRESTSQPWPRAFAVILVSMYVPVHAESINLPFTVQTTLPGFSIGNGINSGAWTLTGTGNWLLDASTGIGTQTVNFTVSFPGLGKSLPVTFAGSGPFEFVRENATNRVGILAESQGSLGVLFDEITINLAVLSAVAPVTMVEFPPFPTVPASPLSLPPLPAGFTPLAPNTLPQLSELGSTGTFQVSGVANVPLFAALAHQPFRGTGTGRIIPSLARCPAGTANPLTILVGTWTFGLDGQLPLGTPLAAAGQFTAAIGSVDNLAAGTLSMVESSSTQGSLDSGSGMYQIFPDCSGGALTFSVSNRPLGFNFWFDDAFGEIRFASTTPGSSLRGSARRF
jgi:hypothetical protein